MNKRLSLILALFFIMDVWGYAIAGETYAPPAQPMEAHVPIRALTSGPQAHWFAYYDKHQFGPTGLNIGQV